MREAEFSQQQSGAESPKWGAFPASASLQVLIFVLFLFISIPLKTKIPMFLALKPSRFCLVLSSHKAFLKPANFFAPDSSDKDDFSSKHYFAILPNGNLNKAPELAVNLVSRYRNLVNYNEVEMPKWRFTQCKVSRQPSYWGIYENRL